MNNLTKSLSALAMGASLALAGSAQATPNLIDATYGAGAGSFELGAFTPRGGGMANFQSLSPGASNLIGWTVGGYGVDWLSTPAYGARDGVHAVDLGYYVGGGGSIATSIATVVGATYNLTFSAAAVGGIPSYKNAGHVSAGSGGLAFAPAFSADNDFANQVYYDYSFDFTALSALTVISFSADDSSTSYGPIIDRVSASLVSVPGGIPEPATWAFMILGFGLIGCTQRARRALVA